MSAEVLDFNFPVDQTYLVILALRTGEIKTRFLLAPDATTAVELGAKSAPDPHQVKIIGAKLWEKLLDEGQAFRAQVKSAIAKN